MNVACTCAGQDEAKPEGTKQEKHLLDMHLMHWRLIGSTVDGLGELTVYVDEDRRIVDIHVGNLEWLPCL